MGDLGPALRFQQRQGEMATGSDADGTTVDRAWVCLRVGISSGSVRTGRVLDETITQGFCADTRAMKVKSWGTLYGTPAFSVGNSASGPFEPMISV